VQLPADPTTVIVATSDVEVTGGVTTRGVVFKFGLPEKPAGNVHVNVEAPDAVNVVVFGEPLKFCEHNVLLPAMVTVGRPTTNTLATPVLVQPCALVTKTV